MSDWIITVPKTVDWAQYQEELKAVQDGSKVMSYRLPGNSTDVKVGDRVFITYNSLVRGWMSVVGIQYFPNGFVCSLTGVHCPAGLYLQRSGKFHGVAHRFYPGFRGIRRFKEQLL